jgi:acetylornithine/N-succinyldiaminopimelate aminotransferase
MTAFAVKDAPECARRALSDQKLVVNATGFDTIRLTPPLTVTADEIDEALARLARVVAFGAA